MKGGLTIVDACITANIHSSAALRPVTLRGVLYACVKRQRCVGVSAAGGGGGWDSADADARAFGVRNQHRPRVTAL